MRKFINLILLALTIFSAPSVSFADVKIKQKVTVEGQGMEQTRMIKGARERRETKIVMSEEAGDFMPNIATITQCDLRRTLQVNDKKKLYTADPFNDDTPTATATKNVTKTRTGGTVTITFTVTDTGERKQMFGLTARHLKILQIVESSADSCSGAGKSKMETDGWYADFSADFNCPIDTPDAPPSKPDCRDRVINKRSGTTKLGFLLDGTMKMFDSKGTVASTIRTETLEISRSPLNAAFFDVGKDYKLVSDSQELYAMPSMSEMMTMAGGDDDGDSPKNSTVKTSSNNKSSGKKHLGLDFFSGNSSKVNQDVIRQTMMESLNAKGFATSFVTSPNEITNGRFDYVVGVEIVSAKQSKAGKIGGLFGKVTGNTDAAKVGDSEAEVVVTIYQKDGKTVVAQQSAKQKIAGSTDDAAKSAIETALNQLVGKIK
ncbi:MAG: hypothetical protein LH472_04035 [Pyrinomonadaceae bacterium]|nr:hypothetical protein [Pyrinomonadaceae bacterium]